MRRDATANFLDLVPQDDHAGVVALGAAGRAGGGRRNRSRRAVPRTRVATTRCSGRRGPRRGGCPARSGASAPALDRAVEGPHRDDPTGLGPHHGGAVQPAVAVHPDAALVHQVCGDPLGDAWLEGPLVIVTRPVALVVRAILPGPGLLVVVDPLDAFVELAREPAPAIGREKSSDSVGHRARDPRGVLQRRRTRRPASAPSLQEASHDPRSEAP